MARKAKRQGRPEVGGEERSAQAEAQQAAAEEEPVRQEEELVFEEEEQEEEAADVLALAALAQMDIEAAEAYGIAASLMPEPDVRAKLLEFRGDHLRHVEDLDQLLSELGAERPDRPPPAESLLADLATAAGALGPGTTLLAMISNEKLTNGTYESVLRLEWDEDAAAVLTRNLEDERRHLRWLEQQRDRILRQEQQQRQRPSPAP